ncbi:MAG: hypothetical protein WAO98_00090 [Alphaproteobacteria bacterium]
MAVPGTLNLERLSPGSNAAPPTSARLSRTPAREQQLTVETLERMIRENSPDIARLNPNNPLVHKLLEAVFQKNPGLRERMVGANLVDLNSPTLARDDRFAHQQEGVRAQWDAHDRQAEREERYFERTAAATSTTSIVSNIAESAKKAWNTTLTTVQSFFAHQARQLSTGFNRARDFVTKTVPSFFTETIPNAARDGWNKYVAPRLEAAKPYIAPVISFFRDPVGTVAHYGREFLASRQQKAPALPAGPAKLEIVSQPVAQQQATARPPARRRDTSLRAAHTEIAPAPQATPAQRQSLDVASPRRVTHPARPDRNGLRVQTAQAPSAPAPSGQRRPLEKVTQTAAPRPSVAPRITPRPSPSPMMAG